MVGQKLSVRWTATALADLGRFASFLNTTGHPRLAATISRSIETKTKTIAQHPKIGRPIAGSDIFREFAFQALNGRYVLRYRLSDNDITILRIFHAREKRD